ncbi:hypothetical protein EON63_19820 [archaeon]|nr:MAG: hypothetical protein EON63_19820 [archaeon]
MLMAPIPSNSPKYLHLPLKERADDDQPFLTYQLYIPSSPAPGHPRTPNGKAPPPVVNLTQVAWYYDQPYAFRLEVANQCMQNMYADLGNRSGKVFLYYTHIHISYTYTPHIPLTIPYPYTLYSDLLSRLSQLTGFDLQRRHSRALYVYDCFELLRERYVYGDVYGDGDGNHTDIHTDVHTQYEGDVASKGVYVQFNYTYQLYNHTAPPPLHGSGGYVSREDIMSAITMHNHHTLVYGQDIHNTSSPYASHSSENVYDVSAGEVYVYAHNYSHPCFIHNISHKYVPSCGMDGVLREEHVKDLLVVAVQRSGVCI